jgi:hypothetical protein
MNILNRLKKIENQITENDSEFCACQKQTTFRIIETPEDDVEDSTAICAACLKPHGEPMQATFNVKTIGGTK